MTKIMQSVRCVCKLNPHLVVYMNVSQCTFHEWTLKQNVKVWFRISYSIRNHNTIVFATPWMRPACCTHTYVLCTHEWDVHICTMTCEHACNNSHEYTCINNHTIHLWSVFCSGATIIQCTCRTLDSAWRSLQLRCPMFLLWGYI